MATPMQRMTNRRNGPAFDRASLRRNRARAVARTPTRSGGGG
jgi:hypothetical protein